MKSPHGSRDGLASRAHREHANGDLDEQDERDERDERPELGAIRQVWLAMRDEDPPERGLAELLAAAHAKVETMQARPTLWRRLIAGFGRPPALALATVLVLVGGAVVLGRRDVDAPVPVQTREPSSMVAADPAVSAGKEATDDEATSMERDKSAAAPGTSPGASIAQLYRQCEAAAKRGDCQAVRWIVDRIARSDRGYRARVAKDSPVGKCLAE